MAASHSNRAARGIQSRSTAHRVRTLAIVCKTGLSMLFGLLVSLMNKHFRLLAPSQFKTMPWRNGGGSTTELLIFPPDACVSDSSFHWRLSLALLQGSGPFSLFPGYDRTIIQLQGQPMRLVHEDREQELSPLSPYSFPGEWATQGILEGQAEDFNVMVRRDWGRAEAHCVILQTGKSLAIPIQAPSLLYVHEGDCVAELGDIASRVAARHLLVIDEKAGSMLRLHGREATIILVLLETFEGALGKH